MSAAGSPRVIVVGAAAALPWVRDFLGSVERGGSKALKVEVVDGPPSRQLLADLVAAPIACLVLAAHAPFAEGVPAVPGHPPDAIRDQALRAILASELARHAGRTVLLDAASTAEWPALLRRTIEEMITPDLQSAGSQLADATVTMAEPPLSTPPVESSALSPVLAHLRTGYLTPIFTALTPDPPISITWKNDCLLDGDSVGSPMPEILEVAGRARILAYGPYLPLPSGTWQMTAYIGFSPDVGRMPFILEVDTGEGTTRGFFEVERAGFFTLVFDFQIADPFFLVEFRLISQDSALEGSAALMEIQMVRATGQVEPAPA
jgi:hypothetical protein